MSGFTDLALRPQSRRYARTMAAVGAVTAPTAAALALNGTARRTACWFVAACALGWTGLFAAWLRRGVDAGPDGVRMRSHLLRRRHLSWTDITHFELSDRIYPRGGRVRCVQAWLRNGSTVTLPLPYEGGFFPDPDLTAKLSKLRALHRRYAPAARRPLPRTA